jgi:anaerobic ribonucleoside-triphosphate reductase
MYIRIDFDNDFEDLILHLRSKYGKEMMDMDGIGGQLDMATFGKQFFSSKHSVSDVSVDANSNVDDYTVVAYENELPKPYMRLNSLYLLWKGCRKFYGTEFANRMIEGQITGDYYINDLSNVQKPYCYNFSTYDVMTKGLPFVKKIDSKPPKHLSSFCGQMVHFTSYASNQVMGAVGLADLLVVMSYYVKKELDLPMNNKDYVWRQVKQELQSLVFSMNQPFRGGLQSGFYNISIYDKHFLNSLVSDYIFPDGSNPNIEIVNQLQDLFIDLMNETLRNTTPTFPVTTVCLCVDKDKNILDEEFLYHMSTKNTEFAFMNIFAGETGVLSSCCRLRSDKNNQYLGYTNSFGSGGTQIGSFGVITLNLPRLAIKAKGDISVFIKSLEELVETSIRINHAKRDILQKRIEMKALPLYDYGFMSMQKQYATTGLNGINEAIELLGYNILNIDGQDICMKILQTVNKMNDKADVKYKYAHNTEQTPSENSSIKLAQKDKMLKYQNEYELYSNQFIPLITQADMLDRIKLQGLFDSQFSGGAIAHINVENRIEDPKILAELIKTSVKKGVVYQAINYNLQKCENNHMSVGHHDKCPICGGNITDNFTRAVGFLVNVRNLHKVRRQFDYPIRQWYKGV